jgi:hypothetical protein
LDQIIIKHYAIEKERRYLINIIKYNTKKINTTNVLRIERFRDVLNYICDNPKRSIKFTKYLRKELTKIFGKQNTRFNTGRIFTYGFYNLKNIHSKYGLIMKEELILL